MWKLLNEVDAGNTFNKHSSSSKLTFKHPDLPDHNIEQVNYSSIKDIEMFSSVE